MGDLRRRLARLADEIGVDDVPGPLFIRYGAADDTTPPATAYAGGRTIVLRDGEALPARLPPHRIRVFLPCERPPLELPDVAG